MDGNIGGMNDPEIRRKRGTRNRLGDERLAVSGIFERSSWLRLSGRVDAEVRFVVLERFEAGTEEIVSGVGDEEAAAQIGIAKSDALAGGGLGAVDRVELGDGAEGLGGAAGAVAFGAGPETVVEDDGAPALDSSRPFIIQLSHDGGVKTGEMFRRWIVAVELRHAFVGGEADGAGFVFQALREGGFPDAEKTMDEMDDGHGRAALVSGWR